MLKSIHLIKQLLIDVGEFQLGQINPETHNHEYEAVLFSVNGRHFRSRLAKKTPTKKSYFVTCWEKDSEQLNQPFYYQDSPEKMIVSVIDDVYIGQFIFPKSELLKRGILSNSNTKGKMAFRIYPSWENNLNKTALITQLWQQKYFLNLTKDIDKDRASNLYFSKN